MVRIGVDVDGVLADFNRAFIPRLIQTTGRDLFGPGYVPTTWDYPQAAGYTQEEIDLTWRLIKDSQTFWAGLHSYPDTSKSMALLADRIYTGDDVYFITARSGVNAKWQTECWLSARFPWNAPPAATVLLSGDKEGCARALDLDIYIDDRWSNAYGVSHTAGCRSYLLTRPWNAGYDSRVVSRVSSVEEMLRNHPVVDSVVSSRLNVSGPVR